MEERLVLLHLSVLWFSQAGLGLELPRGEGLTLGRLQGLGLLLFQPPFLLLFSHKLPLLSLAADQRHAVFDGLSHGLVVSLAHVARLDLDTNGTDEAECCWEMSLHTCAHTHTLSEISNYNACDQ